MHYSLILEILLYLSSADCFSEFDAFALRLIVLIVVVIVIAIVKDVVHNCYCYNIGA